MQEAWTSSPRPRLCRVAVFLIQTNVSLKRHGHPANGPAVAGELSAEPPMAASGPQIWGRVFDCLRTSSWIKRVMVVASGSSAKQPSGL